MTDDKSATEQRVHDEVEKARGVSDTAAVGQAYEEEVKGSAEGVKGKVEEVVGNMLGQDDLAGKGRAEEDEGRVRLDAASEEEDVQKDQRARD
jgi:uncharacterized protein YjbJ (UPF0337 family)